MESISFCVATGINEKEYLKLLLKSLKDNTELKPLDDDLRELFKSWFNPGFLVLKPIDWSTPANILEKIIHYEAVNEIKSWNDLRSRLERFNRRCFAP